MKRKAVSKKVRFEIFKRDSFTCQYCGDQPPNAVLEVDHIDPVANGGGNEIENLITACFNCNRGKSCNLLSSIPKPITDHFNITKEKEDQLKAHKKLLSNIKRRKTREENKIDKMFNQFFMDRELTLKFKKQSVRMFLDKLPMCDVEDAMEVACLKIGDADDAVKYFCGICWSKINNRRTI